MTIMYRHGLCACPAQLQPHEVLRGVCPSRCVFKWSDVLDAKRNGGPAPRCTVCGEEGRSRG